MLSMFGNTPGAGGCGGQEKKYKVQQERGQQCIEQFWFR